MKCSDELRLAHAALKHFKLREWSLQTHRTKGKPVFKLLLISSPYTCSYFFSNFILLHAIRMKTFQSSVQLIRSPLSCLLYLLAANVTKKFDSQIRAASAPTDLDLQGVCFPHTLYASHTCNHSTAQQPRSATASYLH